MHIFKKIMYFVYPPSCYICGCSTQAYGLCAECFNKLDFDPNRCISCGSKIDFDNANCFLLNLDFKNTKSVNKHLDRYCTQCSDSKKSFSRIEFVFYYCDVVSKMISLYKYQDNPEMSNFLVKLIYNFTSLKTQNNENRIVIPVPIHRYKLLSRYYNQSSLLGRKLSKLWKCEFKSNVLIKKNFTKAQASLSSKNRLTNLKNSFDIKHEKFIKNKEIILIDDVVTTGSTISECSDVLKKHGAKNIIVVSLSRVDGILKL